ncbi:MAG: TonB-dependent receptor [Acidobacteriota bacterium]|nr:TonB-dependent receptor [Acidobacteriota bacterium]
MPALAQFGESRGNLFAKMVDEQGGVLPGVSVTLRGPGAPQTETTDARGEVRFLNLSPGTYSISAALQGFTTVNHENISVALGKNTEVTETLKLSSVAATITVTAESPLLDTRKVETGAVITQAELNSIPTGRDPWVMLQSVPGVVVDRVNVAGSESGQQSSFASKGANAGSFTLDGINQTDMSALGASALYFDFDTFQEVQVITGGSDPAIQGSGAHINMITKRGTNDVHGSARINYVSDSFESENFTPTAGRRKIQSVQEYGVETGGPIVKDRLWLWGAYGRNQINILVGAATPPTKSQTTLENLNGKLNWQIFPSNSFTLVGQHSNKLVFGRGAGASRPQAATNDQVLPQNTWKFEDSQVVSSNLFFSAMYAGQNGFFGLNPEGHGQLFYDGNTFLGTSPYFLASQRPQRQGKADVSYFFNTGSMGHELKAGFQYLKASEFATTGSPANPGPCGSDANCLVKVGAFTEDVFGVPAAGIFRDRSAAVEAKYYAAFFGDTITMDRLTVQAGLRWDRQFGSNLPSTARANPSFPSVLPDLVFPGRSKDFTWNDWSPRLGITYALGTNRTTLLKASYSRFVDALGTATVGFTNPLGSSAGAYYPWNDANHNNLVDAGEVNTSGRPLSNFGYNLANAGDPGVSANAIDPKLKAGRTDELIAAVDHELIPGLAVGVAYTYRKYKDPIIRIPYDPGTGTILGSGSFVQYDTLSGTLPNGAAYGPVRVYQVNPAVLANLSGGAYPSGYFYTNQTGYNQTYSGLDFTLTKRLSNRWMARANFTYGLNKQHTSGCQGDPNNGPLYVAPYGFFTSGTFRTCTNGDYVSEQSQGSGSHYAVYLNSKYVYNVNGMYQLPLNFNIAASVFGRQGYPVNYFINTTAPGDGRTRSILVTPVDGERYPSLFELDLRLEKVIPFSSTASVTIAADLFNATNRATVLQKQNRLALSSTEKVREVQSPRVYRFSARVSF